MSIVFQQYTVVTSFPRLTFSLHNLIKPISRHFQRHGHHGGTSVDAVLMFVSSGTSRCILAGFLLVGGDEHVVKPVDECSLDTSSAPRMAIGDAQRTRA